jgi:hypothetical protein
MGASFEGMEGMAGMVAASLGVGGTGLFPDRIDLPFVTLERPQGSPPVWEPISANRCWIGTYPDKVWTTEWYSWLVLTEFVTVGGWDGFKLLPDWAETAPGSNKADWTSAGAKDVVGKELELLIIAARDERPDALGEVISQSGEFVSIFLNLLSIPDSYPSTARLLRIVNFIAGYCAMYYKGLYARPRPSMVCPALLPPIDVPGHASFPSGHSTQTHLIALCIADLLAGKTVYYPILDVVATLADRISRNREIAGVHYPSDTKAGVDLAGAISGKLKQMKAAGSWYEKAYDAAVKEWG